MEREIPDFSVNAREENSTDYRSIFSIYMYLGMRKTSSEELQRANVNEQDRPTL